MTRLVTEATGVGFEVTRFVTQVTGFWFEVTRFVTQVTRFVTPYGLKRRVVRHGNRNGKPIMAENRRLAAARVLKGITQRKLAELVGTREIEISRIETGRITPDATMKQRIAAVLGKPTFEIFDC